jgi:hypothetical protein
MTWTPALTELRAALEETFASPDAIGIVVDDAGIPRARINLQAAPTQAWHAALVEALRLGRVEALISAAQRQYPANARLSVASDQYLRSMGVATTQTGAENRRFEASGGAAGDPHRDARREEDKVVLRKLLRDCPFTVADFYLRQLANDRVQIMMQEFFQYPHRDFYKATFYLHDKQLYQRWKALFDPWIDADNLSIDFFHDDRLDGIARLILNDMAPTEIWKRYHVFQGRVAEALAALKDLIAYVNEHYYEVGPKDLDRAGLQDYKEFSRDDDDEDSGNNT